MSLQTELLWKPLLEAAAQTIVGAIGGYMFTAAIKRATRHSTFDGPMDLWRRGLHERIIGDGDKLILQGIISPYSQLFPGDPMLNATRYNKLYSFQGKISNEEFQAMEFFAGSDAALRIGSLNGETLVGLYARYGFIGEGLVGVVPTKILLDSIPDFFHRNYFGANATIYGRLAKCPAQHGYVAQSIARKSGIDIDISSYKDIYYLQINKIVVATRPDQKTCTLLGSGWAVTESSADQYLIQYGYLSESAERKACNSRILDSRAWKRAKVFYDDLSAPSNEFSFRRNYIA
ncbi:hypothetical protein ACQR0Z_30590 [Bradyrhizobium sp. HKCCYLS3077]|uniref:hypothetical protein n=1 Tax=Bradyrhizobium sp. HKCCYLS3077 TaxID=3420761 RepID=UPI003EC13386